MSTTALDPDAVRAVITHAELVTFGGAAEILEMPRETLRRRWIRNGSGPRGLPAPVFSAGAQPFWTRAQIEEAAPAIRAVGKGRPHKIVMRPVQA